MFLLIMVHSLHDLIFLMNFFPIPTWEDLAQINTLLPAKKSKTETKKPLKQHPK